MIWLWLLACGGGELTQSNYGERYAPLLCKAQRECAQLNFNGYYGDIADCVEEVSDEYDDDLEFLEDCDFDKGEAENCLEALADYAETCEYRDLGEDCDEVWDCGNGGRETGYRYYGEY